MLSAVVSIGTVAALSAGLAAPARTLADAEISILKALAILFVARVMSRTLRTLIPDTNLAPQIGATFLMYILMYILVIAAGLMVAAKARPVPALLLAIGYAVVSFVVGFVLYAAGLLA